MWLCLSGRNCWNSSQEREANPPLGIERWETLGKRVFLWSMPLVALSMLAVMLVPAEVWHRPANDAVYQGFDPNLIFVSNEKGNAASEGVVHTSPQSLKLRALPNSQLTVHLVTSPLSFRAAMNVRILESGEATMPLSIGIWSARTGSGYFLNFGPPPSHLITARTVVDAAVARTLLGGTVSRSETLGRYAPGQLYHLEMAVDKRAGVIYSRVSSREAPPNGGAMESSVTLENAPTLFESLRLSLTASASSQAGIASTALENYSLTLPHQRWQVVGMDDARAKTLTTWLLLLGALLCFVRVVPWARAVWKREVRAKRFPSPIIRREPLIVCLPSVTFGILSVLVAYIILNVMLFSLGSYPFDMTAAKVWSYVGAKHGPLALYHLPNTVSLAKVWGGAPYHEAVFPYHPVMAYYVTVIGWVYRTFLTGPGPLLLDTFSLEFLIKSFNVVFGLADAALIYLILRELRMSRTSALAAGALFLFNPAIWFSMSVWGQNHVVTLLPLLLSIWVAERRYPLPAWLALVAGAFTRPQMLVPAFLLGIVYLRKFSIKENVYAISWSIIIAFLFLAPFSLAISPSAWVDILSNQLRVQEAGGNEPAMTIVSLDAYNIWLLVARLTGAATGLARFHVPSSSALIGALTYQQVSQILVLIVILGMGLRLLGLRRTPVEPGEYLLPLAVGTVGFLVLKTGLVASHFIVGLPFLILCRKPVGDVAFYSIVGIWTATTFASMYGSLGFAIWDVPYLAPALHDTNNAVTRFFMNLHSSDWFITLGACANIAALVGLTFATISASGRREVQAR